MNHSRPAPQIGRHTRRRNTRRCAAGISPAAISAIVLLCSGVLAASPAYPGNSTVHRWRGTLTVLEQQGSGCAEEGQPPYTRRVNASGQLDEQSSGRLFLSGETEAMDSSGDRGSFTLRRMAGPDQAAGELQLARDEDVLSGTWRETPGDVPGACYWTRARLQLAPVAVETAADAALPKIAEAFRAAAALSRADGTGIAAPEPLAVLKALGDELAAAGVQDLALAALYLGQSDASILKQRRGDALTLMRIASRLHRLIARDHPERAAEALCLEAMLLRRVHQKAAAETLYREALDLLAAHGRAEGAVARSVYNSLGVLYLKMDRSASALAAFARALAIDRKRAAPALDVAATLNNLGQALAQQGQSRAATGVFAEALAVLAGAGAAGQQLAELIRDNAAVLERGNGDPIRKPPDIMPISLDGRSA